MLQPPQEQRNRCLLACAVFSCLASGFGIVNMHSDVDVYDCTWGSANTLRESALEADSGRKIPRRIRDSKPESILPLFFQSNWAIQSPESITDLQTNEVTLWTALSDYKDSLLSTHSQSYLGTFSHPSILMLTGSALECISASSMRDIMSAKCRTYSVGRPQVAGTEEAHFGCTTIPHSGHDRGQVIM